jgi:hypothetical protein
MFVDAHFIHGLIPQFMIRVAWPEGINQEFAFQLLDVWAITYLLESKKICTSAFVSANFRERACMSETVIS